MGEAQLTEIGEHILVKGPTREVVQGAVDDLVRKGHEQLETIHELGKNWIATVRLRKADQGADWCQVTPIGLQLVIEASSERLVNEKIGTLMTWGAVVIASPECVQGKWVAVVERKN